MAAEIDIDKVLDKAPEAIPLPSTALEIVRKSGEPSASAKDLAAILKNDQALTARVLKVANSAFYGLPRQVASIETAVVLLGQKTIRNLALTASMSGLGNKAVAGYGLPRGELFKHSLVVGQAASRVSAETNKAIPDEAYTAGLLHDIGKLVLSEHVEARIGAIMDLAASDKVSFVEAEKRLLGHDHADIGAVLAEKWGLPAFLADAIKAHHRLPGQTRSEDTTSLAAVCLLANRVARQLGTGVGSNESVDPAMQFAVMEVLGISNENLKELTVEVGKQVVAAVQFIEEGK